MLDGLYVARFRTPLGEGAGVVTIRQTHAQGGDSAYFYDGEFHTAGDQVTGRLQVRKHSSSMGNVFGIDNFDMAFKGVVSGGTVVLTGTTAAVPGMQMSANLTRVA